MPSRAAGGHHVFTQGWSASRGSFSSFRRASSVLKSASVPTTIVARTRSVRVKALPPRGLALALRELVGEQDAPADVERQRAIAEWGTKAGRRAKISQP
jgi:hypothetical protein